MTDLKISDPKISTPKWFQPALLLVGILIGLISYHYFLPPVSDNDVENTVSRKTADQIDNGKTVLQSKPSTNSQKDPWEIIRELEDELELALAELEKLRAIDIAHQLAEKKRKAEEEKKSRTISYVMAADMRMKRAKRKLREVNNEIKGVLELSKQDSEKMYGLLEKKLEADTQARDSLQELGKNADKAELSQKIALMNNQMQENQQIFEEKVRSEYGQEVVRDYLKFEEQKARSRQTQQLESMQWYLKSNIEGLEEYQEEQINDYFSSLEFDVDEVAIGSYGTPSEYTSGMSSQQMQLLENHLQNLLTEKQYKNYKKKLRPGRQ